MRDNRESRSCSDISQILSIRYTRLNAGAARGPALRASGILTVIANDWAIDDVSLLLNKILHFVIWLYPHVRSSCYLDSHSTNDVLFGSVPEELAIRV